MTIYKSYIRPHLDYCDVIYDQPHNESFCKKIESIQYNSALAITGVIKFGFERFSLYFRFLKCTFGILPTKG